MAKKPTISEKLAGWSFEYGSKITTSIALVATTIFIFAVLILLTFMFVIPVVNQLSQFVIIGAMLVMGVGIFIIVRRYAPSAKQVPLQMHSVNATDLSYLRDLATFAQRSLNLVDDFCFHSINNLVAVKTACVTGQDLQTDAQTVLSYIRSSTRFANMIMSVDFEIGSWSKILEKKDIEQAAEKFNVRREYRDDFYPSSEVRFNDFNEIWHATLERYDKLDDNGAVPFVNSNAGILRTFVIWEERKLNTLGFTWIDWAILKKLSEAESLFEERAHRPIMVNKVIFEEDLKKLRKNSGAELREQQDIILFFEVNGKDDLELGALVSGTMPVALKCSGVRETLHPDTRAETKSYILFQQNGLSRAYSYALGLWTIAEKIDLEKLAKRVVDPNK